MKKPLAFLTLSLMVSFAAVIALARMPERLGKQAFLGTAREANDSPPAGDQQAKKPQWKSTEEYNAFSSMASEKDPGKKISLAEAFLQKFSNSDFKYLAHLQMMGAYQQLGKADKAIDEARAVLKDDPDNLQGLQYLSFALPFLYKPADTKASDMLSEIEAMAKRGLDLLSKLQKPQNVTEEQFTQAIKPVRAVFNSAQGFAALQKKDYASAITSFKASLEDNPNDMYPIYRLGVAYVSSSPPDYNNGLWYLARAVSVGKSAKAPDEAGIENYLKESYGCYHGTDDGLAELIAQAGNAPNPPADFKVAPMDKPKPSGNANINTFNQYTFPLTLTACTSQVQTQWAQLKDQPLGLIGFVHDVEKSSEAGTYRIRITLDQSKVADAYDIELKDSTQPAVGDLGPGDAVHFQGTIASYKVKPSFVLTLDKATINEDDLAAATAKSKAKPARRHKPGK